MPFKTRKRKRSASARVISISSQGLAVYKSKNIITDSRNEDIELKQVKVKYDDGKHDYIKEEVIKISILALIIIGLQIVLKISNIAI